MVKITPSELVGCHSHIVPGMSRVVLGSPSHDMISKNISVLPPLSKPNGGNTSGSTKLLLGGGVGAALMAVAINKQPDHITTGNFPAGILGAGLSVAGLLGLATFGVAKYGGFFDQDRDFRQMFKNL